MNEVLAWMMELLPVLLIFAGSVAAFVFLVIIGANRLKAMFRRNAIRDDYKEKALAVELHADHNDLIDAVQNRAEHKQLAAKPGNEVKPPLKWQEGDVHEN